MKRIYFKKVISIILTLCMLIPYVSNIEVKGAMGDTFIEGDLRYEVITEPQNGANGTVNVSGNNKEATKLVIPETVTNNRNTYDVVAIKSAGFYDYKKLMNITIPNSITSIGNSAFRFCSSLTNIELPDSITSIGEYAFTGCSGFTDIELPNSITSISMATFWGCSSLTSVEIPNSVTSINISAFSECNKLENIIILSDKLEKLASDAFDLNSENTNFYVINENIRNQLINTCKIPEDRIEIIDVSKLHRLKLNSNGNGTVTGDGTFEEGKTVTITATANDGYEFNGWTVNSGDVTLEDSTLAQTTFIMPATDVEITANFSEIKVENTFIDGDLKYEVITQPQNGANGTVNVSGNNKEATEVIIPETVTNNGNTYDVVAIKSSTFEQQDTGFYDYNKLINITIPNSITSIGDYAFRFCSSLTNIELPSSITYIGKYAFDSCRSLTDIELPDSITSIGIGAFGGCSKLINIKIPNSVTSINVMAFDECSDLTSIEIPNSVTSINISAFGRCSNLENIIILSDKLETLASDAFDLSNENIEFYVMNQNIKNQLINTCKVSEDKIKVTDVSKLHRLNLNSSGNGTVTSNSRYIEGKIVTIKATAKKDYKFDSWTVNSGNVTLADSTSAQTTFAMPAEDVVLTANFREKTSEDVFTYGDLKYEVITQSQDGANGTVNVSGNNKEVTKITIPKTVTNNGNTYDVIAIKGTTFEEKEGGFYEYEKLISIEIPDSITSIGAYAFYTCKSLTSIELPDSVTTIGDNAFYTCKSLTSIELPDSVTTIGDNAFQDCTNLTSIKLPNFVTTIGRTAFNNCENLTSIKLPNSITSIDMFLFARCLSLTSIEIPNSITSISGDSFFSCSKLENITILSDKLQSLAKVTFQSVSENAKFYVINEDIKNQLINTCEISPDRIEIIDTALLHTLKLNSNDNGTAFGSGTYMENGTVSIIATANAGYEFDGWSVNSGNVTLGDSTSTKTTFVMPNEDVEITANFVIEKPKYTLTLNTNSDVRGAVYGGGSYKVGEEITITATAKEGYKFNNWTVNSGDITLANSTLAQTTFTMPERNVEITANFSEIKVGDTFVDGDLKYEIITLSKDGANGTVNVSGNNKEATEIVIPKTVTNNRNTYDVVAIKGTTDDGQIGGFYEYTKLIDIEIPDSITSIGESAFWGCNNLTSIKLPDSITSIGNSAFEGCSSLTNIELPTSITSIDYRTFNGCSSLTNIELPDSITSIGSSAFYACSSLISIELPTSITSIGVYTFKNCSKLENITILSDKLESLSVDAFDSISKNAKFYVVNKDIKDLLINKCSILEDKIEIINSPTLHTLKLNSNGNGTVTGDGTFEEGDTVTITATANDGYEFDGWTVNSGDVTLADSTLAQATFVMPANDVEITANFSTEETKYILTLNTNDDVWGAVYGGGSYKAGEEITITATPKTGYKFDNWTVNSGNITLKDSTLAQTTFTMPEGNVEITANFSEIKVENTFIDGDLKYEVITQPQDGANGTVNVSGNNKEATKIVIPETVTNNGNTYDVVAIKGTTDDGQIGGFYEYTKLISIEIPVSITSIGDYAFYRCESLTNVEMPNSITSIGNSAFYNCTNLTSIEIPSSITSIGNSAFSYCRSLINIKLPDSITSIEERMFYGCSSLINVELPISITSIGESAFYECINLTNIKLPDSITSIGYSAFYGCSSLTNIKLPDFITSIESFTFYGCSSLTSIELPDSITYIGERAFYECSNLISIKLPDSLTSINSIAFGACSSLTDIKLPDSLTSIGYSAFSGCSNLANINLPDSITYIDNSAFSGCSSLANIKLPDSLTSINASIFNGCISLTSIELPDSITTIGERAFYECSSLTSINLPDSITSIGKYAFYECSSLISIKLPNSITSIADYTFRGCSSLTSIEIPNSVTYIGHEEFRSCSSLTSVKIPSSVTYIGVKAFSDCNKLENIFILSKDIKELDYDTFSHISETAKFYVVNNDTKNLLIRECYISSNRIEIIDATLLHTLKLNSNDNGTVSGSGTYMEGKTVTIKATAKEGYKFDSWTVNSGNVTLEDSTLAQTTFIMPANDVEITANFSELPKHTLVLNSDSNVAGEVYGSGSYKEKETVTIKATANDGYKFDSWTVTSGNVTLVDSNSSQTTFIMPANDVEITANFVGTNETVETDNKDLIFNIITKPEGETNGTVLVTASNKDITSVDIPETIKDKDGNTYTVVEIEDNAFKDCVNLQEVKLPSTITVIGQNAFDGCIILQIVIITSDNVTIGDDAFTNIANNVIFITTNDSVKDKLLPFVKDESQIQKPEGDIEAYYSVILKSDSNGTVKGNGIYKQGDTVTITAKANDGYKFDGWTVNSGDVTLEVGTLAQTTFVMPANDVEITANFSTEETKYILTLNTNDDVSGAVYGGGSYKAGEEITITATPKIGYKFDNWTVNSGDITLADSTLAQTTFTMPERNVEITANFSTIKVGDIFVDGDLKYEIITLSKDGANGTVNVSGNNKEVTSITIPEIVTNNGNTYDVVAIRGTTFKEANGGFYRYTKLIDIEIPDSITSIGDLAFYYCSNLTSIKLPDSITSIGDYAFCGCDSLTNIKLPDSITSIGDYTFKDCSSLTNIKLPDSITSIGEYAFCGCDSLTNIELPDFITSISNHTFSNCTNLTDIKLPNSLASIGDLAFNSCNNLTNIKLPDSITSIGYSVFSYCSSLTSIKLPDSITSIGGNTFYNCSSLTSIKLSNSLASISDFAFYRCSSLTSIELPNSITGIGESAFKNCSKLENITILSDKLELIYNNTFASISENAKFYVVNKYIEDSLISKGRISADKIEIIDASKLHTLKLNSNDNGAVSGSGTYMEGKTVTITATAKDGYKFDSWTVNSGNVTLEDGTLAQTTFVMPAEDVEITANFVGTNETVETPNKDLIFNIITKPEGETNGTVSVTVNNKDLTSVDIPETIKDKDGNTYTVVEIEDNAFKDCSNLQHIKLPNTIITIGQGAFENCTNLIEITIPSGVTSIGDNAFKGCIILQIVVIISVDITIGKDAFTNVSDNVIYITTNNDTKDKLKPFVKDENQIQVSDGNVKDTSSVIIRTSAGGTATGNGLYKSGDTVNLKATAKDGYKFDKWIVISGNITIENINSETTSFTMSDKNVILMANFVSNSGNPDNNVGDSFVTDDKFIVTVTKPAGSDTQGTVTIVGTTDTSDTITIPSTITDKNGKVYKITFVSDNAFTGNKNIISVIIQNGITSIGNGAFKDCVNLIHISIPDSVTSIGDSAFENCTKLEKIEIPISVILIGNNAFKGCINLSKIIILTIKVIIKNNAFENISKDASFIVINQEIKNILIQIGIAESQIVISKGLHKVTAKSDSNGVVAGSGTYSKDDTVTIKATPNEKYKFDKWTVNTGNVTLADDKLAETTFTMPDEDVEITASFVKDEIVIESNDNLDFIVQKPATENEDGEVTFKVIDKNVTSVTIPSKVKDNKGNSYVIKIIPNNAFEGCTNLKEITIPETIISIGDSAFKGCISLIKIVLPDTITVIGSNAFENCTSLIEITIPKNVELIKDNAFLNCTSLIKVIILSLNLHIVESAFTGISSSTIFIVLNQEVKAILILCHILEIQITILNPESNLQEQIDRANEILMKSYPTLDEVIQSTIDLSDGIVNYFNNK